MRGVRAGPRERRSKVDKLVALLDAAKDRERAMENLARKQAKAFTSIKWLANEIAAHLADDRERRR